MKKLLTVLLTIVMAVCLINLNNGQQIKAENALPDDSYLFYGTSFNNKIKEVANNDKDNVKHIIFCQEKPNSIVNEQIVSNDEIAKAGFDGIDTVYIYGAKKYTINQDSSEMFKDYINTEDIIFNTPIDISQCDNMQKMFYGCSSLSVLDLSNFNRPKTTANPNQMFNNCSNLVRIYVKKNGFDVSSYGTGTDNLCVNSDKLTGGKGSDYYDKPQNTAYGKIDGGSGNEGFFSDVDEPLTCKGLALSSGSWKDGGSAIDVDLLGSKYGIKYDITSNEATFSKSLINNGSSDTLKIDNLTINLADNITIEQTSNNMYPFIMDTGTINGNGHTLNVVGPNESYVSAVRFGANIKINNLISKIACGSLSGGALYFEDGFSLDGETRIEITNTSSTAYPAVWSNYKPSMKNGYIKGAANVGDNLKDIVIDSSHWKVDDSASSDALVDARYVIMVNTIPKPSPSEPVVKDESCEKVIGPTWHWNDSKGICEDYGVVGTSTR